MSFIQTAAAAVTLSAAAFANAAPVTYAGSIPLDATVTDQVGGFGFVRQVASDVDFWSFTGIGGNTVTITGTRIDAALDLALDLYAGRTTADESAFATGTSWGGLRFIAAGDDEIESTTGPFGDPVVTFVVPLTGLYTIAIGGAGSLDEGPYRYALQVTAIPEPSAAALLLAGLGLAAALGRPRQRARAALPAAA